MTKNNYFKKKLWSISSVVFSFVFAISLFNASPEVVQAQIGPAVDGSLRGYAWSYGAGSWISFNCQDGGNCRNVQYSVQVLSNGNLEGYAWSPNLGWIKFGGLWDFPEGGGTEAVNARFSVSEGGLEGWARACSGTVNGDCSTMESHPSFDGWISLRGSEYGVQFNSSSGDFSGYAWGSDGIGWVDFSEASYDGGFEYSISHFHEESRDALQVSPGFSGNATVSITLDSGIAGSVNLSTEGFVSGVAGSSIVERISASFSPSSCTPGCSSQITVTVDSSVSPGSYLATINGNSMFGGSENSTFYLEVVESGVEFAYFDIVPAIVPANGRDSVTVDWEVNNATQCSGAGDWNPWIGPKDTSAGEEPPLYGPFSSINIGEYEFILECEDPQGIPAMESRTLRVLDSSEFHLVECSVSGDRFVGHPITWSASVADDPGNFEYEWVGNYGSHGDPGNETGFTTNYSTIGTKEMRVTVTNPENGVSSFCDVSARIGVGDIIFEMF